MFEILPPVEGNKRKYYVKAEADENGTKHQFSYPTNIHDELISSHQTACEHAKPHFAYYHRHLIVMTELMLNYADEVLREGPCRLPDQLYKEHQREFDAVFDKYKTIIALYR